MSGQNLRAAEIARTLGSPAVGTEHLFLGMLHDGGWPVTVISELVDLNRAEAAVERMKGLRERVAAKLNEAPPLPEAGPAAPSPIPSG